MLEAAILAAGTGSRMGPQSDYVLKPLSPLPGGTLIDYHIRRLLKANTPTHVVCGHLGDQLARHVERHYPGCRRVRQRKLGNAADGVLALEKHIKSDFLVVHGDHFISYNPFGGLISEHETECITFLVEEPGGRSIGYGQKCLFDPNTKTVSLNLNERPSQYNEMTWVDGCMILPRTIFGFILEAREKISKPLADMDIVFSYIEDKKLAQLRGIVVQGWWANINTADDLYEVQRRLFDNPLAD